jgi:hypothetical protein
MDKEMKMGEFTNEGIISQYESLQSVKSSFNKFSPIAYYDKHLDCIRVQLKDCSFTENRLNRYWTMLEENHGASNSVAGFNIKGVQYLAKKLGFSTKGVMKLTDIINKIIKNYPDSSAQTIQERFNDVLSQIDLEVDFRQAA